jgi:AcrR family transcriptional regulator
VARPRSDDKRNAIISAAIRVIASQGLSAATATIAKEAGVSNGSLFTYFETKAELLNQLYLELKAETAAAALAGLPTKSGIRKQMLHMWSNWLRWAISSPEKRRTLAYLGVSDDITSASHQTATHAFAGIRDLLERSRENGPMRDAPLMFVAALMSALAEATIDFMIRAPANADKHSKAGFDALWRMIA